jgi:opacity protein-like surface antigen
MKNLSSIHRTPITQKVIGVFLCSILIVPSLSYSQAKTKPAPAKKASKPRPATKPLPARATGGLQQHSIGIGLGQAFLLGDFGDNGEDKIAADLLYAYKASHSFDFYANFHTSSHKLRETKSTITGLALGIRGRAYQFDAFAPFIVAGLGFYQPQVKRYVDQTLLESEEKITFGVHVGGGADLQLSRRVSVGVMGHYHNPFDVQQDLGPDVEGAYFKLLLTAMYHF